MAKRFVAGFLGVYIFNSFTGYFIHDFLLHKAYVELGPVLHTEQIMGKIWAFIVTSITGAFFFTLIYSAWKKNKTIVEGL